jgi:DNA-binding response OmpR family regulator
MAAARAVLIVEANPAVRTALAELLGQEGGVEPTAVGSVEEAEALLARGGTDLVILSVDTAGSTELTRLRRARLDGPRPVTLLLVPDSMTEEAAAGCADDILHKPFRLGALLARVGRMLRDLPEPNADILALGPFRFHPGQRVLHDPADNRRIRLTEKEAAILLHLHRADGAVERQVLLNEVWGYNDQVSTHTLETHIYKLRQKIEANPSDARLLVTEGGGYRLLFD